MSIELRVPAVGESITEVQIGDWLKPIGAAVKADEAVVVIETDKVTVELPAPIDGQVVKVLKKKGEQAKVGEVIGYMEAGAAAKAAPSAPKTEGKPDPKRAEPAEVAGEVRVMPAAKRALAESGLAASAVTPTGPGGRMLKEDVERAARAATQTPSSAAPAAPSGASGAAPRAVPAAASATPAPAAPRSPCGTRDEEVVPMTPLRKRIAQRLVEAQANAAILTTFNEVDMGAVMELRKLHQERFVEKHKVKLGFMSFFVKSAIEALKEIPQVNAEIRGDAIVYRNYYDVGIAVGGGKGLVVPILRNAERLSFAEIELAIAAYGQRAKENKLTLEELSGGTFTISNGGIYGSLLSTPILNPPQSGILGLHAIQDRPVARNGQVVIRPMMYIALSYDHRIVDGREAVTFLKRIKDCMEDPARMLLEV
ncbi:MAG: 2-oxoglutarate dehydrogenase complex dihydrolipoyllysine-residue succinyltransferase [Planctomycetes bacterium]|nr:2-oxoglutarate dehydrogenase complex dihydrolipoyllysine-residue succinyltransferase [Planctomycetota bacterium]